jgi:hypothetical protein
LDDFDRDRKDPIEELPNPSNQIPECVRIGWLRRTTEATKEHKTDNGHDLTQTVRMSTHESSKGSLFVELF